MNKFVHHFRISKLKRVPVFQDESISLWADGFYRIPYTTQHCDVFIFRITLAGSSKSIGEIALRIGEGDALYYLGHIGYHIDEPYRGHHYALKACRLTLPVFEAYRMNSFSITTDPDNWPSMKTCQALGCILESTVPVPLWCQKQYEISKIKNRYIYILT